VATQPGQVLLQRGRSYALVAIGDDGAPSLVSVQSTPAYAEKPGLVAHSRRAAGYRYGPVRIDF
jgi:hypothetical protein